MGQSTDLLYDIIQFLRELIESWSKGALFLGGPFDIFINILDIVVTTLVIYFVLKIIWDSRAWQLLKGIILIVLFSVICSLFNLNSISYLLGKTISILTIAFVVIFQPELRRALETVGRNTSQMVSLFSLDDTKDNQSGQVKIIESIVQACEWMADTMTGALIIIERRTKLGDFMEQENVVILDSAITTTMLKQIFYKGSPLHDGAALIRNGRIAAARVHVPLSDNYHLKKEFGTRHRAAVGASELGDTIAIVISEERGKISVAIEGHLYILENSDSLRTVLHELFLNTNQKHGVLYKLLHKIKGSKSKKTETKNYKVMDVDTTKVDEKDDYVQQIDENSFVKKIKFENEANENSKGFLLKPSGKKRKIQKGRVALLFISFFIAIFLWLLIQVTYNPILSKEYNVTLSYVGNEQVDGNGYIIDYPFEGIKIKLNGRKKVLEKLKASDIKAYVDVEKVEKEGLSVLPVEIQTSTMLFTSIEYVTPDSITINVRKK